MTNYDTPSITSRLYNVQPVSHTSKPRIFPSLLYTTENLKIKNSLTLQTLNKLHSVISYLISKHAMQHMKTMLAKLQTPSVSS